MFFQRKKKEECEWINPINTLFLALVQTWGVSLEFERKYVEDYRLIMEDHKDNHSAWKDKYSTTLYGPSHKSKHWELQPIPDFVRWLKSGELHYLSYEKTTLLYESSPTVCMHHRCFYHLVKSIVYLHHNLNIN